ncbi:MAG TPA: flagellar brake protein [Burkholderiaceae bacterium]|nr:flagellar brake protein [Burkholderiaceae bacterium]
MAADHPDPFLVESPRGVLANLRAVVNQGTLLHMRLKSRPQALITTLLEVDGRSSHLVVDASADDAFNRRLLATGEVQFSTVIDGVRLQFDTMAPAQTIMHDGRQALQFPFPHALRRIQRRDHFRVDIPVSAPLWCQVPASEKTTETLRVKDISAGGLALFDPETLVDAGVGSRLEACTLELPDIGTITFTLTVQRVGTTSVPGGAATRILACQFHGLSPSHEIMVRNYIGQLERMLLARRKGFD